MLALLFTIAVAAYVTAYFVYGRYMTRVYGLDNARKTPAQEVNDGTDYCPTHPAVLLGHHFASIAGAGPIVGPIAAAGVFGWLPVYVWCVLGSIFIGGRTTWPRWWRRSAIKAAPSVKWSTIGSVIGPSCCS